MAEHPEDGLVERVVDSDFPDYEEVESDHLSCGTATSIMTLDDSGAMSSSASSSSSFTQSIYIAGAFKAAIHLVTVILVSFNEV